MPFFSGLLWSARLAWALPVAVLFLRFACASMASPVAPASGGAPRRASALYDPAAAAARRASLGGVSYADPDRRVFAGVLMFAGRRARPVRLFRARWARRRQRLQPQRLRA